ncbi:hypothetical protein R0J91_13670, partial [Micrococcus sp. SIMBA_131]
GDDCWIYEKDGTTFFVSNERIVYHIRLFSVATKRSNDINRKAPRAELSGVSFFQSIYSL